MNAFGNTVKEIGTVFADLVHDAGNRKPQAPRFDAAPSVASKSAAIGYAMQMEFSVAATRCARRRSSPPGPPTVT